jgi:four helix bundle protein
MAEFARSFRELQVYRTAMDAAMTVFEMTRTFPAEERYSMVDQVRRSSRSVCGNIAEAWRKRRYRAAFIAKLSDAEAEAAETQVWIELALRCKYLDQARSQALDEAYEQILAQLVAMIRDASRWVVPQN